MIMKNQLKTTLSVVAIASLTACGGGGGGGGDTAPAPVVPLSCTVNVDGTSFTINQAAAVCTDLQGRINAVVTARTTATADAAIANTRLIDLLASIETKFGPAIGDLIVRLVAATQKVNAALTSAQVKGLEDRIVELVADVRTLTAQRDARLTAAQVAQLNAEITALRAQLATAQAADRAALLTRISLLEARLATANGDTTGLQAQITALNTRIASLETELNTRLTVTQVAALNTEITTLRAQLAAMGDSTAAVAAAEALRAAAAADLAAARLAVANAAAQTAAAQALVASANDATARAVAAEAAAVASVAAANAARNQALAAQAAAEANVAAAQVSITGLNAEITSLRAQLAGGGDAATLAALRTRIAELETRLAMEVGTLNTRVTALQREATALQASLAAANADRVTLTAEVARLNAEVVRLNAVIAAGNGNPVGRPLCVAIPTPITGSSTFPGAGTSCVISYADQIALATARAAEASSARFEGVYARVDAVSVAEVGGRVWTFEEGSIVGTYAHNITSSNGSSFSATGQTLARGDGRRDVTLNGTYARGTSATLTVGAYTVSSGAVPAHSLALTSVAGTLTIPAGVMGGQDRLNGTHNFRVTTAVDGSFTGADASCRFTGNFSSTPFAYQKVTLIWGAGCDEYAIAAGAVGTGVIVRLNGDFIMITDQPTRFTGLNVPVIVALNPTFSTGTAVPAAASRGFN